MLERLLPLYIYMYAYFFGRCDDLTVITYIHLQVMFVCVLALYRVTVSDLALVQCTVYCHSNSVCPVIQRGKLLGSVWRS